MFLYLFSTWVYRPISSLFDHNFPTIIAGDLNVKHTAWGCVITNPKGRKLLRLACDLQFSIEAPADPTHTHQAGCSPDILDIFITKHLNLNKDPRTSPELSSDHYPVLLEIPFTTIRSPIAHSKTDWLLLKYHLENSDYRYSKITFPDNLDSAIQDLSLDIASAMQKATILLSKSTPHSDLPQNLLNLIKSKNQILRRF